jgi:isochorismate synthase
MNKESLDFLSSNLQTGVEFALIGLPSEKSAKRRLSMFTNKQGTLTDMSGRTLTLRPFSDMIRTKPDADATKSQYMSIVQRAVDSIHAGRLEKVVLARTKTIDGVTKEALIGWYERLLEKYPRALVFIVSTEKHGLWIGATPELLVEKNGKNFHTIALAATSKSATPRWSPKDYDEHMQVVSYLSHVLTGPVIKNLVLTQPRTTQFGNLSHLKTDVDFSSDASIQEISGLIHPTPALCGFPKKAALEFIQENEAASRALYTGSMIIEDEKGDGVSYAFLRCARLSPESRLVLFAGCGIVEASVPQQEWEESEAKIASVLSLL